MDPEMDLLMTKLEAAVKAVTNPTAEALAMATYVVLVEMSMLAGQKPDIEVSIWAPGERRDLDHWRVSWEAGPYDWAVEAASLYYQHHKKVVEPYYSFDLCFYPWLEER